MNKYKNYPMFEIAASGGNKALAEGIDIMIQDNENNVIYVAYQLSAFRIV